MSSTASGCAVVTGAAGGIGTAVVQALLAAGTAVVGVDLRDRPDVLPADVAWVAGDASDDATLEAAMAAAARAGGADALVTSTFLDRRTGLLELTAHDLALVLDQHVGVVWRWSARLIERLPPGRAGAIVHIASVHAYLAAAGSGPYAAAKAALISLTRTMAVEWGPRGVRCNAVAPGFVPVARNSARWADPDHLAAIAASLPLRRVVSAADVANCVAFLLSRQAGGITGVCVPVDGGMLASMPAWA